MRPRSLTPMFAMVALLLVSVASADPREGKPNGINQPLLPRLPDTPTVMATTVPANGDVNPYGVVFIPRDFRHGAILQPGDILVSNFNNSGNLQGTGSSIVRIDAKGNTSLFFEGEDPLGLTTALGVLKKGFVLVGDVPTTNGSISAISTGKLIVLDRDGLTSSVIEDSEMLDGPWYLTVVDEAEHATVFVSNVLNGTVTRLRLRVVEHGRGDRSVKVESMTRIASGYLIRPDPAALVVGPTGLVFDRGRDVLYVASTGDNAIYAIANPLRTNKDNGKGKLIYSDDVHLHGPLAMIMAPNGNLIVANGDAVNADPNHPSELTEFTPRGKFVAERPVDLSGEGGAFGIAIAEFGQNIRLAAVDDVNNTLEVWSVKRAGRGH